MPAIAAEAGVVVETIYRAFGSKAGLFKAVLEAALAGGSERAELPPAERPAIRAVIEETDPSRKLELYADTQPGVHGRSSPLYRVLVAAADSDPELKDLLDGMEARRLHGLGGLAAQLAESRALRSDVSVDDARDIIWTLCSTPVHDLLVRERGWTSQRYRDWLAAALKRELLEQIGNPTDRLGSGWISCERDWNAVVVRGAASAACARKRSASVHGTGSPESSESTP